MTEEKSGEFRGKTVEAAVNAGLAALRLSRDEAEIEIIRPGSRGVLGIGAEDAVVRVTAIPRGQPPARQETRPAPVPTREPAPLPESQPAPRPEPKPSQQARPLPGSPAPRGESAPTAPRASEPRTAAASDEKAMIAAQKGREILAGLLERMNLDATVEVVPQSEAETDEEDEKVLVLNIQGDDLGVLIGRQNETLSALEYLTRLMVNQQVHMRSTFVVDVNGYRAKRAESLRKLALRMADQVVQTGRTVALEPMPPAERRIIHIALRDHPTVETESVGEGDRRKVTVIPKRG
jgi:spoIIIJ-associated protein